MKLIFDLMFTLPSFILLTAFRVMTFPMLWILFRYGHYELRVFNMTFIKPKNKVVEATMQVLWVIKFIAHAPYGLCKAINK